MENLDERILIRIDKNLRKQLEDYANRNDEGNISLSARRAIKMFITEQSKIN